MTLEELDLIEDEREEKVENIIWYMKWVEWEIGAIDNEIARLSKMKTTRKNRIEWLKWYISMNLQNAWIEKINVWTFALSFRKSKSLIVEKEDNIPNAYMKEKTTVTVDKATLKKDIEDGLVIEWVHIQVKHNLQIK